MDKVYLYDDKLVVSMWFSEDDKQEITWRDWFSLDEYWTDESPFVKGGGVEFDCFPLGSTNDLLNECTLVYSFFCRVSFCGKEVSTWIIFNTPLEIERMSLTFYQD